MTYSKGRIWLGYTNGLWRSGDDGKTWEKITSPVPTGDLIADIDFFDEANGLLCTGGMITKQYQYFLTRDAGVTWTELPPVSTSLPLQSKFVGDPQRIVLADIDANIMLSTDGGLTFRRIFKKDSVSQLHCIQTRNSTISALLLIGDNYGARIYSTTNDGMTWTVGRGLFAADSYSFAFDSCDSELVYVTNENYHSSSAGRILVSRDGADSFIETEVRSNDYYAGSVVTTEAGAVYAQSRTGDGVLRSIDGGLTWKSIGGPPGIVDSRMLTVKDDNTLFAVDSFGSVWATVNSGGDSLLLPFGTNVITDVRAKSEGQIRVAPLDTAQVRIGLEFAASSGIANLVPDSVQCILQFRSGSVNLAQSDIASNIIAPAGWTLLRGAVKGDTLLIVFGNSGSARLAVSQDFGAVIFRANGDPDVLTSTIFVEGLSIYTKCRTYTVRMTPEADFLKTIAIGQSSVEDELPETLIIYPNPAQTEVTIESTYDRGNVRIEITNDLGKVVLAKQATLGADAPITLDLRALASGAYRITLTGTDIRIGRSIIIAR